MHYAFCNASTTATVNICILHIWYIAGVALILTVPQNFKLGSTRVLTCVNCERMYMGTFIAKFYDKAYEDKTVEELVKAPVSAISGVSESDALVLNAAFLIKTVEDLATNKYVKLAQGINNLSECSVQILDKTFESKIYEHLAKKPVSDISGISDEDAALLKRIFGIDTIKEMAENKYVLIAQTTVAMALMLQFLRNAGIL